MPAPTSFDPQEAAEAKYQERTPRPGVELKKAMCTTCDVACSVVTESKNGRVVRVRSSDNPIFKDNICFKGIMSPKGLANPKRILHPLRRGRRARLG